MTSDDSLSSNGATLVFEAGNQPPGNILGRFTQPCATNLLVDCSISQPATSPLWCCRLNLSFNITSASILNPCLYSSHDICQKFVILTIFEGFSFSILVSLAKVLRVVSYPLAIFVYVSKFQEVFLSDSFITMPNRFARFFKNSFCSFSKFSQRPLLEYSPAPLDVPPEPSVSVVVTLSLRVPSPHQLCHPHRHQCNPSTESTITGCESSVGEDIAKICHECFPSLTPAPKFISLL